MLGLIEAS